MKHGDFTGLAGDYSDYRPDYAPMVLRAILGASGQSPAAIDAVDVGAGTGIWTRMLAGSGLRSVTAVEPNADMRGRGQYHPGNRQIAWHNGSGEATGLAANSADLLTMASSFHWVDFELGTAEFIRVLRPGGTFAALWNPRYIENNPLLLEIEAHLATLMGGAIKRVSSGRSEFTDNLSERLASCGRFSEVAYIESRHTVPFTQERYLGAWRSVNDLRVQLGDDKFAQFMDWVARRIEGIEIIEASYLTRAWVARTPA